ncbi:hypothetical protein [Pseudoalteromonas sp. T1lg88]|uniref:hypothetical protein n=1 Tax=Pseudoalteromonas sp. T1lg88 TaxID=2077104 RepID=UPI00131A2A2F|nr:hypothetical protein [Pseudoalteromonas sp. T1lg88]
MVKHSKNIQILAYVCALILLPGYSLGSIAICYITYKSWISQELYIAILLSAFSGFLIYFSVQNFYLLCRFIKTLKINLEFDHNGIILCENGANKSYSWNELKKSKAYPSCQIFCLIDVNGNHLFSIWEYAKNYSEFRKIALEKLGI